MEQFLRDLLVGHTGDELYYPLLHGPAGSVQLLNVTTEVTQSLSSILKPSLAMRWEKLKIIPN